MLFKKLFKNERYKNLEQKYRDLTNRVNALNRCFQRQNEELRRILENYVPGSITGYTITDTIAFGGLIKNTFYLYKNGREYVFNGLNLCSPKLIQGKKENIVYAEDNENGKKYVLDLYNKTFIEIEGSLEGTITNDRTGI